MSQRLEAFAPIIGPTNVTAATSSATEAIDVGHRTGGTRVPVLFINKDTTNNAYIKWVTDAADTVSSTTGLWIPAGYWGVIRIPGDTTHIAHIRADAADVELQFWVGEGI